MHANLMMTLFLQKSLKPQGFFLDSFQPFVRCLLLRFCLEGIHNYYPLEISSSCLYLWYISMKSYKTIVHSMFLAKLDTLEHFEMNLIIGLEIQLRVSKLFFWGGGVPKTLDNVQSFALFWKPSLINQFFFHIGKNEQDWVAFMSQPY